MYNGYNERAIESLHRKFSNYCYAMSPVSHLVSINNSFFGIVPKLINTKPAFMKPAIALLLLIIPLLLFTQELTQTGIKEIPMVTKYIDSNINQSWSIKDKTSDIQHLNHNAETEAYPFLSADGLRLYFSDPSLVFCSRKNIDQPFGEKQMLSRNIGRGFYAGTLTLDELEIYMSDGHAIYRSQRKTLQSEFTKPEKVSELTDKDWDFYAPAISPDGKELIVIKWKSVPETRKAIRYYRDAEGKFKRAGEINMPDGYEAAPGQFSKDGLQYLLSLNRIDSDRFNSPSKLYVANRSNIGENFSVPESLPDNYNLFFRNLQPSMSVNGSLVAYVKSDGKWTEDDLVLIQVSKSFTISNTHCVIRSQPKSDFRKPDSSNVNESYVSVDQILKDIFVEEYNKPAPLLKVYPNPFKDKITLEIRNLEDEVLFVLFDINGRILQKEKVHSRQQKIKLDYLTAGPYSYSVMDSSGNILFSGKLIKN